MSPAELAREDQEWRRVYARHERLPDGRYVPKPYKAVYRQVKRPSTDAWRKWEYVNAGLLTGQRRGGWRGQHTGQASEWRTPGLTTKPNPRAYKFKPYPIAPAKPRTFEISATNLPHRRCAYRDLPIVGIRDIALKGQLNWLRPTP